MTNPTPSRRIPFVGSFLAEDLVVLDAPAESVEDVIGLLVARLQEREGVSAADGEELRQALMAREQLASTAIGLGVACPHAYVEFLKRPVVLFARLARPLDLGAPDDIPTDLVFMLVGHEGDQSTHLETLMQLSRLLQQDSFRDAIHRAKSPTDVIRAAEEGEGRLLRRPSPKPNLSRAGIETVSGRPAGGLLDDIRRRLPCFRDDFLGALRPQTVAATIFLFFACFTGALTFGAIMAEGTGGAIGVSEMILATAIGGILYACFSGQPLILLGGIGPVLIFTTILYDQTQAFEIPFLPAYGWIGLWAGLFTILLAVTDASVLMRYLSRFTDEVFVILTAFIFIEKAVHKLTLSFATQSYAAALSTSVIALGTFAIALVLRDFRSRTFLRAWARNFLADFGTVIAILLMAILASGMEAKTDLHNVSLSAEVSFKLVDLGALPLKWILLAALPGAFLAILLFLCQQITGRVCNAPELNLTKGPGYHLDLFVVGVLLVLCSLLGLPWLVAATVRSLNHVQALSSSHPIDTADGGHVLIDRVLENRLSGVLIHVLIACSLLLIPVLEQVPLACLYGIFLYMGFVSFSGNQLFQRLTLWVQDPALYPPTHYLRKVPTATVHWFTAIQFAALAFLCAVQYSPLALFFPLLLALLVPLRFLLTRFFQPQHLAVLDAEETVAEELDRYI